MSLHTAAQLGTTFTVQDASLSLAPALADGKMRPSDGKGATRHHMLVHMSWDLIQDRTLIPERKCVIKP